MSEREREYFGKVSHRESCRINAPRFCRSASNGLTEEEMKAAREWLRSCFLSGQKLQMVHHGADLASFASMRLQLEGTRLLITARLSEVAAICQQELNAEGNLERADGPYQANVQDCVNWLIRLDEVPPATQIPSLCSALIKPGDVTYLPPGYLVVDKACHETNISLNLTRFQYGCVCATACRCSSVMRCKRALQAFFCAPEEVPAGDSASHPTAWIHYVCRVSTKAALVSLCQALQSFS